MEAHWVNDRDRRPDAGSVRPERAAQFMLDQFAANVDEQDGRELPDRCIGDDLPDLTLSSDPAPLTTQCCGGQTRFELPYLREDDSVGWVTACASCDLGIRWARLAVA